MSEDQKAAEIIRDLAAIKQIEIEGVPCVLRPNHFTLDKFPDLLSAPKRSKQHVTAHDVAGFIAYINKFKTDATAVFAALEPKPTLKSILDYHAPGAPSHCEHSVSCGMEHAEEWKRWMANNSKRMDQKMFGLFLEDNQKDVLEPKGADLLKMALNFSSIRQADFKSSQRLQDGIVQFQYVEDEKAGELKMPERIKLGIPVFRSGEAYKITARLKYTIKEQVLTIWYELERPDLVLDDAYSQAIKYIEEKTGIAIYRGMPA